MELFRQIASCFLCCVDGPIDGDGDAARKAYLMEEVEKAMITKDVGPSVVLDVGPSEVLDDEILELVDKKTQVSERKTAKKAVVALHSKALKYRTRGFCRGCGKHCHKRKNKKSGKKTRKDKKSDSFSFERVDQLMDSLAAFIDEEELKDKVFLQTSETAEKMPSIDEEELKDKVFLQTSEIVEEMPPVEAFDDISALPTWTPSETPSELITSFVEDQPCVTPEPTRDGCRSRTPNTLPSYFPLDRFDAHKKPSRARRLRQSSESASMEPERREGRMESERREGRKLRQTSETAVVEPGRREGRRLRQTSESTTLDLGRGVGYRQRQASESADMDLGCNEGQRQGQISESADLESDNRDSTPIRPRGRCRTPNEMPSFVPVSNLPQQGHIEMFKGPAFFPLNCGAAEGARREPTLDDLLTSLDKEKEKPASPIPPGFRQRGVASYISTESDYVPPRFYRHIDVNPLRQPKRRTPTPGPSRKPPRLESTGLGKGQETGGMPDIV